MTLDVVEIRDLDGPNWFRMEPVIKLAVNVTSAADREQVFDSIATRIATAHELVGETRPAITSHTVDDPDQLVVAFDWRWRSFAVGAARFAVDDAMRPHDEQVRDALQRRLEADRAANDVPLWVRDSERAVRSVGITGTNGKTTTTRLLAHIAQLAGKSVGWSSSTGVYINGRQVLEGDYSGPSGARRVLQDPDVELGILETARGGLLQRGLAYESNDVGVFLNVSADHLSLHGVETVETLAEVKSVVVQVTRPDGLVVLNADDPLVLRCRERVRAQVCLISQEPDADEVRNHIQGGGAAVVREGEEIVLYGDSSRTIVADLADVPASFGGAAPFMVENVLAATAGAYGLGLGPAQIAAGLSTFRNDSRSNRGRLNIFDVDQRTVVIDYAHNDIGLAGLARFSRSLQGEGCRLHLIIGTAGDRRDEDFMALGRVARKLSDVVYLKDTPSYLRGREPGDMPALMRRGFEGAGGGARLAGEFEDEYAGFFSALENSSPGDVIAVMCQMDQDRIIDEIRQRGGDERRTPG